MLSRNNHDVEFQDDVNNNNSSNSNNNNNTDLALLNDSNLKRNNKRTHIALILESTSRDHFVSTIEHIVNILKQSEKKKKSVTLARLYESQVETLISQCKKHKVDSLVADKLFKLLFISEFQTKYPSILKHVRLNEKIANKWLTKVIVYLNTMSGKDQVIKWIVSNFDFLNQDILRFHYQLFFTLLTTIPDAEESLTTLLIKLTTKKEVLKHRIDKLLGYKRKTNFYMDLLRTYQKFDPSIIISKDEKSPPSNVKFNKEFSIENIFLPNRISDILNHEYNMLLLSLYNYSDPSIPRLSNYLKLILDQTTKSNDKNNNSTMVVLNKVNRLQEYLQESIKSIDMFLISFLCKWDGFSHRDVILSLLTRINVYPFEYLYSNFLEPILKLFNVMNITFQYKILEAYGQLLKYWLQNDWICLFDRGAKNKSALFTKALLGVDYYATMLEFTKHFEQLAILSLMRNQDHPLLQHQIIAFYQVQQRGCNSFFIPIPPKVLIRRIYLSGYSSLISRLCQVLMKCLKDYKAVWQYLQENEQLYKTSLDRLPIELRLLDVDVIHLIKDNFTFIQQSNLELAEILFASYDTFQVTQSLSIYNSISFIRHYFYFKNSDSGGGTKQEAIKNYLNYLNGLGYKGLYNLFKRVGSWSHSSNKNLN
ncbi:hypothetical protein CYY_002463 [Polysphondylium violaceum]|uniref:Uncharacterized protein n=1 Tax=Polysphondylium violaceum TaxID=133409 RepID=A0A8J4Q047_9MYCE|nr:hypothetical protein CYY_002463 [Polysphondylium violaceum]